MLQFDGSATCEVMRVVDPLLEIPDELPDSFEGREGPGLGMPLPLVLGYVTEGKGGGDRCADRCNPCFLRLATKARAFKNGELSHRLPIGWRNLERSAAFSQTPICDGGGSATMGDPKDSARVTGRR